MGVVAWLHGFGQQQYERAVCRNAVNAAGLQKLLADDLKNLGVIPIVRYQKLLPLLVLYDAVWPPYRGCLRS